MQGYYAFSYNIPSGKTHLKKTTFDKFFQCILYLGFNSIYFEFYNKKHHAEINLKIAFEFSTIVLFEP